MVNTKSVHNERSDRLYHELEKSMDVIKLLSKVNCSVPEDYQAKHMFLLGAVHALRAFNNFEVPEIELAFKQAENFINKEELKCMLKLFSVQESITL